MERTHALPRVFLLHVRSFLGNDAALEVTCRSLRNFLTNADNWKQFVISRYSCMPAPPWKCVACPGFQPPNRGAYGQRMPSDSNAGDTTPDIVADLRAGETFLSNGVYEKRSEHAPYIVRQFVDPSDFPCVPTDSTLEARICFQDIKVERHMRFHDFLQYDGCGEKDPGLLMHDSADFSNLPPYPSDFGDLLEEAAGNSSNVEFRWVVMSATGSGARWHQDPYGTAAWSVLLEGRKIWMINSPSKMPDMNNTRRHGLKTAEIVLTQEPGDAIFIPSNWWHSTISAAPTKAFTQNISTLSAAKDVAKGLHHQGFGDVADKLLKVAMKRFFMEP